MSSGYQSHLLAFVFSSLQEIPVFKERYEQWGIPRPTHTNPNQQKSHVSAEERETHRENAEQRWHFREPFLVTAGRSEPEQTSPTQWAAEAKYKPIEGMDTGVCFHSEPTDDQHCATSLLKIIHSFIITDSLCILSKRQSPCLHPFASLSQWKRLTENDKYSDFSISIMTV